MSTPVLEKVSVNIPLQQEYYDNVPCNSGFPFDRDDQEGVFRSQLDDLAKRHPELAEHFEGYPFHDRLRRTEDPEFRRFRERPFGSRFEGFGFPFEERSEPHPHYDSHEKQETPQPETSKVAEEKEVRKPQNLQQSNTVDLGQQQEPEVDDRGQRSMSAPPENNSGQGQRFVSSVNIPIMRDAPEPEHKEQGHSHSQQPQERVIPIMVEGRDEPVIPKNVHQTFGQPTHKPSQSRFGGQPETIFGHQPGHFTKFVHPAWGQHEDMFYQQKAPPQQERAPQAHPQRQEQAKAQPSQHSQQQHAKAQPPQQKVPQPHPQPQQQSEVKQPSPPPQPKPLTPIEVIQGIQKEVMELMTQVEQFTGKPKDKQYLYLDEMLTRNMIKLDNVDTQGQENVRSARKEAIKCIEKCLSILDAKAKDNLEAASTEGSTSQTESLTSQPSASSEEKMEVEKVEEKPEEVQKDKEVQEVKEVAPEPMEVEKEEEKVEVKSEESTSVMEEAKDDDEVNESTEDKKEKKKGKKKAAKS